MTLKKDVFNDNIKIIIKGIFFNLTDINHDGQHTCNMKYIIKAIDIP